MKPHDNATLQAVADRKEVAVNNICCMCLTEVRAMAFKNTGVCGENCRKDRDNDHEPATGILNGT